MKNNVTLEQIKKEVKALDPDLEKGETFNIALILMSSCIVGPNIQRLSKFTRFPRSYIAKFSRRLRENRVWVKGKIQCEWFEKEAGGIAFWMDVMVAQGIVTRCKESSPST